MCGIFGVVNDDNAAQTVLAGLKRLEYRGYDSWGIAVPVDTTIQVERHIGKIVQQKSSLRKTSLGIGHTRWATHGGVTVANAHPHLDCSGMIVVVHNGILENYQELKLGLSVKHVFTSQTDTEVFAHVIEELRKEHEFVDAVRLAFLKAKGLNALIAMDPETSAIVVAKIGSPVIIGRDATRYFVASDPNSLAGQASHIRPLEDGEMVVIRPVGMELFNLNGQKKILKLESFSMDTEEITKGTFPHFMLKELHEQPRVLSAVVTESDNDLEPIAAQVRKMKRVAFIACGGSMYPSMAAQYIFAEFAPFIHVDVFQGNEFGHFLHTLKRGVYPIFISQSGETIDLVQPAHALKKAGVRFGALTNVYGSTLYRLADDRCLLRAGPEISVASTKSFTNMLGQVLMLAGILGYTQDKVSAQLHRAVRHLDTMYEPEFAQKYLKPIARTLAKHRDIFIIGRGVSYPIAFEAALKFKEIAYIHAEAFAGGELKHGMIALIQKGSPCIVLARQDDTYSEILSNAAEVKARGGWIVGVGAKQNSVFDVYIPLQESGIATCIEQASALQQLAYYTAAMLERDIDKPRNLAKSVVVK